jgi:hypothetical protein
LDCAQNSENEIMLMNKMQRWIRWAALSAQVLAAAILGVASPAGAAKPDDTAFHATSTVSGLKFMVLNTLPEAPRIIGRAICNCLADPTSEGGKLVKARGWAVTGEAPMGRFEAVSFAARFEDVYGGSFAVRQGNVAMFEGPRLIALVYGAKASDEAISFVEPLEGSGVRIWDGESPSHPVGDIRADGSDLRLGPLAAEQSFCHGKAVVPNIYGMPIGKARALLQAKGWKPAPSKLGTNEDEFGREIALAKRGVVEVSNCSGTGLGFCSFDYIGADGRLGVTTVGDDDFPSVSAYGVTCR